VVTTSTLCGVLYIEHVDTPYRVRRTRFHNLPVYLVVLNGGNRPFTTITKVEGDIWVSDGFSTENLLSMCH